LLYFLISSALLISFQFGSLRFSLGVGSFLVLASDTYCFLFMLTLASVSCSVLIWSYFYIGCEPLFRRFVGLLLLFLLSMFILVFSADLLRLFVAWDLLGLTSFYLIIFYRSRASLGGGILTGLSNRVGDVFLLCLFGFSFYGTNYPFCLPGLLLLVVSFTKSAQAPFSSWLPAAMLAPTPVSALVHSSTLVTAGVYLLFRFFPLALPLVFNVGLFTTLMAGLAALLEADSKKIIALSTLSQLGLMVSSLGIGARSLCFAHLSTHAAFKALLFLAMGTCIHGIYGSQEVRGLCNLVRPSPLTLVVLCLASSSLCGLVFLSGWATKDAILEYSYRNGFSLLSAMLFYVGIGLTAGYRLRLTLFLCGSLGHSPTLVVSFSLPLVVKVSLFWLALLSVVLGYFLLRYHLWPTVVLCVVDKILVTVVAFVTVLVFLSSGPCHAVCSDPFMGLVWMTFLQSRLLLPLNKVQLTEVRALQAGGIAVLPSSLLSVSVGSQLLAKGTLLLFVVFVLI